MKNRKKACAAIVVLCLAAGAFSYNPPPGGELIVQLQSPLMLSGGTSAAGGALLPVIPGMAAINPALTAGEQRIVIDIAYTALAGLGSDSGFGNVFNLGAIIPSRWGVASVSAQGIFVPFSTMKLGNFGVIRGGFSKDITENLYLGAGLSATFGSDWGLNLDLGIMQTIGKLGFIQDFRWGAALTGMGKPYAPDGLLNGYPAMFTLRAGAAGTLVTAGVFTLGASLDLSFPVFQNVIVDMGLEARFNDIISIRSGWTVNIRECIAGRYALIPSAAISVRFKINSADNSFLTQKGWQQSEIVPTVAARNLYEDVTAFSAGTSIYLGQRDIQPPAISIWGD